MADAGKLSRDETVPTAEQRKVSSEVIIRELIKGDDASAFRTLNEEWIALYFKLEAMTWSNCGTRTLFSGAVDTSTWQFRAARR